MLEMRLSTMGVAHMHAVADDEPCLATAGHVACHHCPSNPAAQRESRRLSQADRNAWTNDWGTPWLRVCCRIDEGQRVLGHGDWRGSTMGRRRHVGEAHGDLSMGQVDLALELEDPRRACQPTAPWSASAVNIPAVVQPLSRTVASH